jgi:hypothetical protein
MNHAFSLTQGVGSGGALRVLGPAFAGRLKLVRAGAAMQSDAASVMQPALPDTPRFMGAARRLLVEEARANAVRNPNGEGALAGSPGTMPTHWRWNGPHGVVPGVAGTGTEDGIPYVDIRFAGAATQAGTNANISPEQITSIAAASGQVWTMSCYLRLVAGSFPGNSLNLQHGEFSAGGGFLAASTGKANPTTAALAGQRIVLTRTLANASTAYVAMLFFLSYTAGQEVDFTLRVGAPQIEIGGFASSTILPAPGSLVTSNRAADVPVWTPPGGFGGQGTIVVKAMLPQGAPFGASQGLWQIDDGSDLNRIQLRNTSAGAAITGVVDVAGSTLATLSGGNMAPGTPFRAAFTWAAGDQALCLTGGTVQSAAVALPSGLARMLVGHGSTLLNRAANGEVELVDYRPARVSNALLQALANAG